MFKNFFSRSQPKVCKIIAVASGKGGVGKSTTAVNLAYALKSLGLEVGLMDADIYGPSLPLLLHETKPVDHTPQESSAEKIIPPSYAGVKMLSIGHFQEQVKAAVMRGPMVNSLIKQLVKSVSWGELDYLIIDYPPGTGDIQITLSQIANLTGALIVTTPQELSLADVRKAIHMFKVTNTPLLGLVENMSSFVCDNCDKEHQIFLSGGAEKMAEEISLETLGKVPLETQVAVSSDGGLPLVLSHPESRSAKAYFDLAKRLHLNCQSLAAVKKTLDNFSLTWQKA